MAQMRRIRSTSELRAAMKARDLSHREVALVAKISTGTLSGIVAGRPTASSIAVRIARFLRRPVDDLFASTSSTVEPTLIHEQAVA